MFNKHGRASYAYSKSLKRIGFIEGHLNPEYHIGRGITYKDSDVFYFYRKGFGREDNVDKIKWANTLTKGRMMVPEGAVIY